MMPRTGGLHAWAMGRSTSRTPRGSQVRGAVACAGASGVRAILSVHVQSPQLLAALGLFKWFSVCVACQGIPCVTDI